ncbi:unnamed protein product [Peronospora farinosa]|uniref:Peroxin-13 n=1 Tax=Peronospora farinosa TaxID=134698 RepID=A0AAV0T3M6_9STRA|nr:unnamed protein product [Peronospora farinosa]
MTSTLNSGTNVAPAKPWENRPIAAAQTVSMAPSRLLPSNNNIAAPSTSTFGVATASPYGASGYGATGGYGSGYGGMSSRMGYINMGMMDPNAGSLGWLSSFNQIVSSIGHITELLGMNAEALNFCIGSFVHFLERIGAMCAGTAVAPRPVFPPGHPRHGEPPVTEEEKKSRKRRVRIFQFMVSMTALALLSKGLRWLARLRLKTPHKLLVAPPSDGIGQDLEHIFQRTVGVTRL